jgi:hypothetical protein
VIVIKNILSMQSTSLNQPTMKTEILFEVLFPSVGHLFVADVLVGALELTLGTCQKSKEVKIRKRNMDTQVACIRSILLALDHGNRSTF